MPLQVVDHNEAAISPCRGGRCPTPATGRGTQALSSKPQYCALAFMTLSAAAAPTLHALLKDCSSCRKHEQEPPAGLPSAAQCKKKIRKLVEKILAEADELEKTAKQAYLQQFYFMLKRNQRDLRTMRAEGRFGAAPAVPAVESVPRCDGMVRQKPFLEPGCDSSNATVAATKKRRSTGIENQQSAWPFVVEIF